MRPFAQCDTGNDAQVQFAQGISHPQVRLLLFFLVMIDTSLIWSSQGIPHRSGYRGSSCCRQPS